MPPTLPSPLIRLRRLIAPDELGYGWMPLAYLGYLLFLFVPLLMRMTPVGGMQAMPFHLGATLASVVVFLPLYALFWRSDGVLKLVAVLGIFALSLALFPLNTYANTYVIYAASAAGVLALPLRLRIGLLSAMLLGFIGWMLLLRLPAEWTLFIGALTAVIGVAVFFANHFQHERERKNAELKLSRDEVRRIAAFAERERIGRDLHDLLGHTLSMIALKSELAGKLLDRDTRAARREIDDVARISRETLEQVRTAVSGIRSAVLASELASARLLLESADIGLRPDVVELPALPADVESALAMTLREACTNVQRHAGARQVRVQLRQEDRGVRLRIHDDGRGGALRPGTGLSGMRERIERLGGRLDLDGRDGTTVSAWLPLDQPA